MANVTLRGLLAKLTALALATAGAPALAAAARPVDPDLDTDSDLHPCTRIDAGTVPQGEAVEKLGRALAGTLTGLRPLQATQLVASWAVSPDPLRRHAVATALEWTFPLVGDELALDHLSRDTDPSIRAATARAAWARRTTCGDAGVLERLAADPDPDVRAVATAATR
ncbi:MAG: hypothetical protein KF773_28100 [Deltaproteobacteria bacterium]|nr:hypothetical protein [Deltaproteobacteria bacterium]MCW5806453.1 hypothetical protein [Deltaproteobacteria bacterium]